MFGFKDLLEDYDLELEMIEELDEDMLESDPIGCVKPEELSEVENCTLVHMISEPMFMIKCDTITGFTMEDGERIYVDSGRVAVVNRDMRLIWEGKEEEADIAFGEAAGVCVKKWYNGMKAMELVLVDEEEEEEEEIGEAVMSENIEFDEEEEEELIVESTSESTYKKYL